MRLPGSFAGTQNFSIWTTDSNGNILSNTPTLSGTGAALETLESSFHQDLNGDGVIGVPGVVGTTTVIESFGSTSLVQVGGNYYLDSISSGTGPELKNGGAVVAGQAGAWSPVGAEQTASGYEVAWRFAGTQNFSIWTTDSNGNILSNTPTLSGTGAALETLETSFHQDLNGDGTIGIPAATSPSGASPHVAAVPIGAPGNDTFVFHPGFGTHVINNGGAATFELDGFSLVTSNAQLTALLSEAQAGQSPGLFEPTNGGHVIELGNHDSIVRINAHLDDLHASSFIVR